MSVNLDLADIQGNILAAYGKQGYPIGRVMLFRIDGGDAEKRAERGRNFVAALRPRVTTALRWDDDKPKRPGEYVVPQPDVTLNIAFTFAGLVAVGTPARSLRCMPDAFIDGMAKRAAMLGDDFCGAGWRDKWDEVWQDDSRAPQILVSLNARLDKAGELEALTDVVKQAAQSVDVTLLDGHNHKGGPKQPYQELKALTKANGEPRRTEHFGLADGISDPCFDGQYTFGEGQLQACGNGAVDGVGVWRPLATGEFLLGYPDEAQEIAGPITPIPFFRNGTFMAYRKLHQNVASWRDFVIKAASDYQRVAGIADHADAVDALIAKIVGRWRDGVPLSKAPTIDAWREFNSQMRVKKDERARLKKEGGDPARIKALGDELLLAYAEFGFADDRSGDRCPLTSHTRRANTRDGLDPRAAQWKQDKHWGGGSILNNRRRILRRGLPYGDSNENSVDGDDHGIVMMILCADLFRQFEFVQSQWINYGLDARSGSNTCPLVGNHSQGAGTLDPWARKRNGPKARFTVPADRAGEKPPFMIDGLPQLVELRGGDYFFVPSLSALRMIAQGAIDPT